MNNFYETEYDEFKWRVDADARERFSRQREARDMADVTIEPEHEEQINTLTAELTRARRVIADLEKALVFVADIDPHRMYPDNKYAWEYALGACEGQAMVGLASIPTAWRKVARKAAA